MVWHVEMLHTGLCGIRKNAFGTRRFYTHACVVDPKKRQKSKLFTWILVRLLTQRLARRLSTRMPVWSVIRSPDRKRWPPFRGAAAPRTPRFLFFRFLIFAFRCFRG